MHLNYAIFNNLFLAIDKLSKFLLQQRYSMQELPLIYIWKLYSGWRTRAWGHCKSHGHRGRKGQTYDGIFSNLFLTHNQDKDKSNFFLNTSNTLFLLFNFLSLQVKKQLPSSSTKDQPLPFIGQL